MSAQVHGAVKEKSTNTKTNVSASANTNTKTNKSTANNKKSSQPTAKNTNKSAVRPTKSNKPTPVKPAAAKAVSTKDDIAWAQGVGAINKFKPDGSKPYYKQFEDYVREVIAPRVPGAALTMVADGQV
ncbi:MAG TPA: hypothetical protein PKC70_05420, partial [Cellvibrionaceae bacterium]|nr:hypothetical protein [Cellvibrionaceae bacterium]